MGVWGLGVWVFRGLGFRGWATKALLSGSIGVVIMIRVLGSRV